ncbi:MAG: PAS domain-containing protein, partial [Acidobacteria bacterium]|nr:PAS domain-containing protein [Acidobacteriota bacterium]
MVDLIAHTSRAEFTELGQIAVLYNKVMDSLQGAVSLADSVVRNISEGVVTIAPDGLVVGFNPGAENLFGRSAAEVIGQPATLLLKEQHSSEDTSPGADCAVNLALSSTKPMLGCRKNGDLFPADISLGPGRPRTAPPPRSSAMFRSRSLPKSRR